MSFAYLSVNSFMRNASKPGPPAVIRHNIVEPESLPT